MYILFSKFCHSTLCYADRQLPTKLQVAWNQRLTYFPKLCEISVSQPSRFYLYVFKRMARRFAKNEFRLWPGKVSGFNMISVALRENIYRDFPANFSFRFFTISPATLMHVYIFWISYINCIIVFRNTHIRTYYMEIPIPWDVLSPSRLRF